MIKKFFSGVLSSFVGAWLALTVFSVSSVILSFALLGSMSSEMNTSTGVQDNSILYLNLAGSISERQNPDEALKALVFGNEESGNNLGDVIKAITEAKENQKVKGIFIDCKSLSAGMATLKEIRDALVDFKTSGKWIIAYGDDAIMQGDYYLASVADSIYLNPVGVVDIHGLSATLPFFKNVLDKVGVEMQVLRVGTFKSAVEPYIETEASPANRTATEAYLKSLWGVIATEVAESRAISVEKVNELADNMIYTQSVDYLLDNKLIDGTCYKFELERSLKEKMGIAPNQDLNLVSVSNLANQSPKSVAIDKVAVVYAVGGIDDGEDGIVSKDLVKDIIDIAKDDAVKAVVLRVNSPGGSAFGSEQIWAALEEVKKAGKPFAVSMGDYAASGGYYISCGADRIFAEPLTLTGSIGIFGMIPCFKELLTDKIGVNFTEISTNKNGMLNTFAPMTPVQREAMQRKINNGYELFTKRCAEGRGMQIDSLKAIAEGRVWDGTTALKIGLVDELGGMNSALNYVVEKAKLGEYSISEYPKQESSYMRYLKNYVKVEFGLEATGLLKYQSAVNAILERPHLQCIMEPVEIR